MHPWWSPNFPSNLSTTLPPSLHSHHRNSSKARILRSEFFLRTGRLKSITRSKMLSLLRRISGMIHEYISGDWKTHNVCNIVLLKFSQHSGHYSQCNSKRIQHNFVTIRPFHSREKRTGITFQTKSFWSYSAIISFKIQQLLIQWVASTIKSGNLVKQLIENIVFQSAHRNPYSSWSSVMASTHLLCYASYMVLL